MVGDVEVGQAGPHKPAGVHGVIALALLVDHRIMSRRVAVPDGLVAPEDRFAPAVLSTGNRQGLNLLHATLAAPGKRHESRPRFRREAGTVSSSATLKSV
jgi:hypothetical protein